MSNRTNVDSSTALEQPVVNTYITLGYMVCKNHLRYMMLRIKYHVHVGGVPRR